MSERQPLGISLGAATDAQLKAALLYLDERIDAMGVDRREIADEIDRRAKDHLRRIDEVKREALESKLSGEVGDEAV